MRRPKLMIDPAAPWAAKEVDVQGTGVMMRQLAARHAMAPRITPYRFPKQETGDIAHGVRLGLNIMLVGPTGCGKTSLPTNLAGYLGRPLVRLNMNGETRVSHIIGQQRPTAQDGVLTLTFSLGAFAQAMKGGYWVVLDEIEAALPSVLFVLQPVLEEGNRTLHVPDTGEVIEAHPEFAIFATGNTLGYRAAMRSRHAGTNVLNSALIDRFGMVIDCHYPSRGEEFERLKIQVPAPHAVRASTGDAAKDLSRLAGEQAAHNDALDGICRVAEELRKDCLLYTSPSPRD